MLQKINHIQILFRFHSFGFMFDWGMMHQSSSNTDKQDVFHSNTDDYKLFVYRLMDIFSLPRERDRG